MDKSKNNKRIKLNNKAKEIIFVALIILLLYSVINNIDNVLKNVSKFINIIKPFIYGSILGYLFLFPVRKLQKILSRGKKTKYDKLIKVISLLIVYLVFFASIYFLLSSVLPFLYNAAIDILEHTPSYFDSFENWVKSMSGNKILSKINVDKMFQNIRSLDISQILLDYLKKFNIQNGINAVFSAAGMITKTFIAIVVSFNIILYNESLSEEIKLLSYGLLGKKRTNKVKRILFKTNEVFINFIYGQFLDSIVVSIIFVIAFLILRIKHAVALGVLIGIGNLIPYIGTFVSIGAAFIVTCFTGGLTKGILLLVVAIVLQQIDAQIINPAIIGDQLDLNPSFIILVVLIGGAYLGPIIVFLAAPFLAVVRSILIEQIEDRKVESKKENIRNLNRSVKLSKDDKYKQTYYFDYNKNYRKQQEEKKLKAVKKYRKRNLKTPKVQCKNK